MYTFFWRATPHPALTVFDAPDGFSICTRRIRSNTPLQSLTLLNDEAYVEFSQAMAAKLLKEAGSDDERITRVFRYCLSRSPSAEEKQRLRDLLNAELAALKKAPEEAKRIVGSRPSENADLAQLAAWTTISRVILNLDETITRE
jgi:hypothetical protein